MINKVLIVAGGTGGHIFPGLAVARALQEKNISVEWIGAHLGLESQIVPKHHIPLHIIQVTGLRGKGLKRKILSPFVLLKAFFQSVQLIRKIKPNVVLAMGGYVCGPVGIAAWITRKPLVIHEQNAILGLTNRILSYFAKEVLTGFNINSKYICVGNPVREEIANLPFSANLHQPLHLLIFGGSQGAASFNFVVPEALSKLPSDVFEIKHQSGKQYLEQAKKSYHDYHVKAEIIEFIEDMAAAYQWADVIISRAGALTIAELAAAGKASILIPFPYAVDDHQTANATYLSNANAAILLPHATFNAEKLLEVLKELIAFPDKIKKIAENARKKRRIDSVGKIIESLFALCC